MEALRSKAWENFETVLNSDLSIGDAWDKLINLQSDLIPTVYWEPIRSLNVRSEQNNILVKLEDIVKKSPMPASIVAIWIGIVKLWDSENSKEYYAIYLAGSDTYDTENPDWAVDPPYFPLNRYIDTEVLNSIDSIISIDKKNYSLLDWLLPIAYTALTINDIIATRLNRSLFLKYKKGFFSSGSKDMLFVAVGYDDGDVININPITK